MTLRQEIRKQTRALRMTLSQSFQNKAAIQLTEQLKNHPQIINAQHIAIYLTNDGELNTSDFINWCWQQDKSTYLPVIHPFNKHHLIFLKYQQTTKMNANKFNILEPKLDASQLIPVDKLEVIFTPLVAFDKTGARLGMGGGFYDRTLAPIQEVNHSANTNPAIIGLAHDCQEVTDIPTEHWDIPLPEIITPTQLIKAKKKIK